MERDVSRTVEYIKGTVCTVLCCDSDLVACKGVAGPEKFISSQVLSFRGFGTPPPPSIYGMFKSCVLCFSLDFLNIVVLSHAKWSGLHAAECLTE
jgi:hypothetical protein